MTTFRTTLLRLANEQDADERLRLSGVFASELELAFNQQGNRNQLALSDTEEAMLTKIDRLHEQVGNNNTLISAFLTSFPLQFTAFQGEMRAAVEATAHSLGKFGTDIQALKDGQAQYAARLNEMDARHGGQWEEAMTLYRGQEVRLDSKRQRIEALEADVRVLQATVAGLPTPDEARRLIAVLERLAAERGDGK